MCVCVEREDGSVVVADDTGGEVGGRLEQGRNREVREYRRPGHSTLRHKEPLRMRSADSMH